jgi:Holliday junction resolvase-like predicted endonuclease
MNEFFPDRAVVLAQAARLVESGGLTVLDRDCGAVGHRLDLVAFASDRTLVAVEVTVAAPGAAPADAEKITFERMLEILRVGSAWRYAHDGDYTGFRVDGVVPAPDSSGAVVPWHAQDSAGDAL